MADDAAAKKKQKHPYGALFWGSVAGVALFRALYHPWRALLKDGFASRCAGDGGCDPSMTLTSFSGQTEVFTPVRAVVGLSAQGTLLLLPNDEAVVLEYRGAPSSFLTQVVQGQQLGAGQQVGLASTVNFAVYKLERSAAGTAQMGAAVEPASYLATHGAKISAKYHAATASSAWCGGGRKLVVPQAVASQCGVTLPAPSGYALLPVSVTMA